MSDYKDLKNKDLTDNDENSESTKTSTTTSTINTIATPKNSASATSSLAAAQTENNASSRKQSFSKSSPRRSSGTSQNSENRISAFRNNTATATAKMSSSSGQHGHYEIEHLADDQYDDNEYNLNDDYYLSGQALTRDLNSSKLLEDLEPKRIVDYFDENELQPTTADMILDFEPSKALELSALASSSIFKTNPISVTTSAKSATTSRSLTRKSTINTRGDDADTEQQQQPGPAAKESLAHRLSKKLSVASSVSIV